MPPKLMLSGRKAEQASPASASARMPWASPCAAAASRQVATSRTGRAA